MISYDKLISAITKFRPTPDPDQSKVIKPGPQVPLFVVAGPGTGKTTVLTLRILKLVLVDDLPSRGILATTFTVKAAEELRSRLLGWGFKLIDVLLADSKISSKIKEQLRSIDINQVWTGTIDSLCEQLLRDYRSPGTQPPVLADEYVSKTLMLREGLFGNRRYNDTDLDDYLAKLNGSRYQFHAGKKAELLQKFWERRYQDQVDWRAFISKSPKSEKAVRQTIAYAHRDYEAALKQYGMVDFSLLENEVLLRIRNRQLYDFTKDIKMVLVDEYQDSNLMQEQLYFELAASCRGVLMVVGDDDQSLYRFRGATVELFRDFPARYKSQFGKTPKTVFLSNNYRSTDEIRAIVNNYASLDKGYQKVRVAGKPPLSRPTPNPGMPILGMFRNSIDDLSKDLAHLIHNVFRGKGIRLPNKAKLICAPKKGDVGDCALLCSSPAEWRSGKHRLPLILRQELLTRTPPIQTFNPRGEDLPSVPIVQIFGGLLLECLDPGAVIEPLISGISNEVRRVFQEWRNVAIDFANGPTAPKELVDYATGWIDRDPGRKGFIWPPSVPIIDLIYGIVHFFPELYDDPEGQVYLEVFTRQLSACEQVGKFGGRMVYDLAKPGLNDASVKELLRDFLGPIASYTIKVNEDLMESFPRDRLNILSIHQSKGLEFPLTIVDVGSDFKDRRAPRFKRMPNNGATPHRLEDLLRPYSPSISGTLSRGQVDRAFDDLFRQFFVAFSRAQDVLLLVGVKAADSDGRVENVATGWDRDEVKIWAGTNRPYIRI